MSPAVDGSIWLETFENRFISLKATVNSLKKEAIATPKTPGTKEKVAHKIAALENALIALTAPKPQRRRGPIPKDAEDGGCST